MSNEMSNIQLDNKALKYIVDLLVAKWVYEQDKVARDIAHQIENQWRYQ